MRIDILIILPFVKFLNEGACLILSTLYGLLQSFDDRRDFTLQFGLLCEDDRFDGFGRFFLRRDIFNIVRHEGTDEVCHIGIGSVDGNRLAVVVVRTDVIDVVFTHCSA